MIKKSSRPRSEGSGEAPFRENAEINAKIDAYIRDNPKHWDYIQSMPPERMARALVLNEVHKNERKERMRASVLAKLDQDPEMKEHIEGLAKRYPEDQRERAKINIASQTLRAASQNQKSSGVRM